MGLHVQYGCGWSAPDGWLNYDASPTLAFERIPLVGRLYTKNAARFPENVRWGNIVRGLPLPDGSCEGIYASHVLEHLSLEDCRKALAETRRLLGKGGIFRLVVPDLEAYARAYVEGAAKGDPQAAPRFMEESFLGRKVRRCGVGGILQAWLGNNAHLWMWDYPSLAHELQAAGFSGIRRAAFGDSPDPAFAAVEEEKRFISAVAIEASG